MIENWTRRALLIFVAASACGEGGGSAPSNVDAGSPTDANAACANPELPAPPAEPALPSDPAPPAPPVFTPCPPGWSETISEDPLSICEPFPVLPGSECVIGEAQFPGDSACEPIGAECPAGIWATDLPDPASAVIKYVRSDALPGGTGTPSSPYARLDEALSTPAPVIIALGKGSFVGAVSLPAGVTLWGACAEETSLTSTIASTTAGTVNITGRGARVRNLRIAGPRKGIVVTTGASLEVSGVLVENAEGYGIDVDARATITGEGVIVRGTVPRRSDGRLGVGLAVDGGAATLSRVLLERNHRAAAAAGGTAGASLALSDLIVRDTLGTGQDYGRGVQVEDGATATILRAVFERNRDAAIYAGDPGTTIRVEDCIVRDTQTRQGDRTRGFGAYAREGARVELVRAVLERNHASGVLSGLSGAYISLVDAIVRDTQSEGSSEETGFGVIATASAAVDATRVWFLRNKVASINAEESASVTLTDVTVADTLSAAQGGFGHAIYLIERAHADIFRAALLRNRSAALLVDGAGTSAEARDLFVADTYSGAGGVGGIALAAQSGATLEVDRARLERNRNLGVWSTAGSRLVLNDLTVVDTLGQEADDRGGRGLEVSGGTDLTLNRALFERNRDVSVLVAEAPAIATIEDLTVRDTSPDPMHQDSGSGLIVQLGAIAVVTRAVFERNSGFGVLCSDQAMLSVEDLLVRDTTTRVEGELGFGLTAMRGARLDAARVLLSHNTTTGLAVVGAGTEAGLVDIASSDTESRPSDLTMGFGMVFANGAQAEARRVLIERNRDVGILVATASVTLDHITIRDTRERACAPDMCTGRGGQSGFGIASTLGASVHMTEFEITKSALAAVSIRAGGTIDLERGRIAENRIGIALLDSADFDISRLQAGVCYLDNQLDLDSREGAVTEFGEFEANIPELNR